LARRLRPDFLSIVPSDAGLVQRLRVSRLSDGITDLWIGHVEHTERVTDLRYSLNPVHQIHRQARIHRANSLTALRVLINDT